jgi:hypothetical protein
VVDLYSTDPEIQAEHLRVLEDDLHHFPEYRAVLLVRTDLADRVPEAPAALETLAGDRRAVPLRIASHRPEYPHRPAGHRAGPPRVGHGVV